MLKISTAGWVADTHICSRLW